MPRGRPPKPLAWHLLTNRYRPSKHGPLPAMTTTIEPDPEPRRSPSEQFWAFQALPDDVRAWEELLDLGTDFFRQLPPELTEKQAKRKARSKWEQHGETLVR